MGENESHRGDMPSAPAAALGMPPGLPDAGALDLADALADAAAGLPGATERLALRLKPPLQALLQAGQAGGAAANGQAAGAGEVVQWLWRQISHPDPAPARAGAAGNPRPGAAPGATPDMQTLYRVYLEHAVHVVHSLAKAAAQERHDTEASVLLEALRTLESLAPQLAHIVRWRWFGGLGLAEIAQLQDQSDEEAERAWHKARAFLAAAADAARPVVAAQG